MADNHTNAQETVEISTKTLATLTHETSITLNQMRNENTPAAIMEHVEQAFDEANNALDDTDYSTPTLHSPRNPTSEADALVEALEEAEQLDAQMKEKANNQDGDEVDNWEPDYLK